MEKHLFERQIENRAKKAKENHSILYHGTSFNVLKKILKEGQLIPQGSRGSRAMESSWQTYREEDYYGKVFLSDNLYISAEYSMLVTAKNGEYDEENDLYVIMGIEVNEEELLPDLMDAPCAKTWEESLEHCNHVAKIGYIPKEQFRYLLIYDGWYNQVKFVELDNWEEVYIRELKKHQKKRKREKIKSTH